MFLICTCVSGHIKQYDVSYILIHRLEHASFGIFHGCTGKFNAALRFHFPSHCQQTCFVAPTPPGMSLSNIEAFVGASRCPKPLSGLTTHHNFHSSTSIHVSVHHDQRECFQKIWILHEDLLILPRCDCPMANDDKKQTKKTKQLVRVRTS